MAIINKNLTDVYKKKVGKADEPKLEELEFIYSRIEEGLQDSVIIDELIDYLLIKRSSGSIKRRRKEYHAAKKVLEELINKKLDPAIARQRIRHWNDLAEAARYIKRNIDQVKQAKGEMIGNILTGSVSTPVGFNAEHKTPLQRVNSAVAEGLLSHLQAEKKGFLTVRSWRILSKHNIQTCITRTMLKKLELVGRGRVFTGSCIICESWK